MGFERHRTWIVSQTELLVAGLAGGADLRAPVPSCPGWTLGSLLRHVGGGHRWAAEIVRTRATGFVPDSIVRDVAGDDGGAVPGDWLLDGAHELAAALGEAGPDAEVWTPFEVGGMPFWARRFAHETLVHRADAMLAAGVPFEVATEVAVDALDEWMELDAHPVHFDLNPAKREILGAGRTIALIPDEGAKSRDAGAESRDVGAERRGEGAKSRDKSWDDRAEGWFVDLTGTVNAWRRGGGPAAVTVRAPLRELLLMVYRRRTPDGMTVEGDTNLLHHWLGHVAFG
ncbi:maleylpyruvate isomerase family mycothiol-dependent enzyme [Dactylosporangium sp. NPDC050688]|uniref:maleylpyruvate isomerase family mycothiol-dependent enzyme n=1 Tax=Dactylosporangium sp. NPDC050688 TaxID=3157217 RepID=UPI0033E19D8E